MQEPHLNNCGGVPYKKEKAEYSTVIKLPKDALSTVVTM